LEDRGTYGRLKFSAGAERGTIIPLLARISFCMNLYQIISRNPFPSRSFHFPSLLTQNKKVTHFSQSGYLLPATINTSTGLLTLSGSPNNTNSVAPNAFASSSFLFELENTTVSKPSLLENWMARWPRPPIPRMPTREPGVVLEVMAL
jgi:hypothetical protein